MKPIKRGTSKKEITDPRRWDFGGETYTSFFFNVGGVPGEILVGRHPRNRSNEHSIFFLGGRNGRIVRNFFTLFFC